MKVLVGVSNHHVHLTKEDLKSLFDTDNLEQFKTKDLVQPGQYATSLVLTVKTEKDQLNKLRVLGPVRNYTQVEISKTDAYKLGIDPPIRTSGDLDGAAIVSLINNSNTISKACCIIANRHIHITSEEKNRLNLPNVVAIEIHTEKGATLENVFLKESDIATTELHIDTDDANACLLKTGDEVDLIF